MVDIVKDSKDFLVLSHLLGYVIEPLAGALCIVKTGSQIMQFGKDFLMNETVVNRVGEEFSDKTGYELHRNSTVGEMLMYFSESVIADSENKFWKGRKKTDYDFDLYRGMYIGGLKSRIDEQAERNPEIYEPLQENFAKVFDEMVRSTLESSGEKL